MKPGCATCLYRHECFPAHFQLPPLPVLPAEHKVKNLLNDRRLRRLLPSVLFAVSAAGTGIFLYTQRDRLGALSEVYLGYDIITAAIGRMQEVDSGSRPHTEESIQTQPTADRQRVWDLLSTRPEILNSFIFCSCGCGERVDYESGQFEMKHGRVFNREHFRCEACSTHLRGTMHSHATFKEGHEEESWVFHKEGKLYCVNDFIELYCHECSSCGTKLGDQLAVDPRLGMAFCVGCFEKSENVALADRFHSADRVERQYQGENLLREVKQWMRTELGVEFNGQEGDIPLSILQSEKMNRLKDAGSKKEGSDASSGTLGLTVKQPTRTSFFSRKTYEPKEVILVEGLSKEHAGAVLAHEMMHCWIALYLSRHSDLPEEVEEGLCELLSYFWLVHERDHLSPQRREEVEFLLGRMERNWDNAQGRGFHRALSSLQGPEHGNFLDLLSYARDHCDFPLSISSL